MKLVVLLCALLVAASLGVELSMREQIIEALDVNLCKPEKKAKKKCDTSTTGAPACKCVEKCRVWGDPYVAPFYSSCFVQALKTPKEWFTIWNVPERTRKGLTRAEFYIDAFVDDKSYHTGGSPSREEWIMRLKIKENHIVKVLDAASCVAGPPYVLYSHVYKLTSDTAFDRGYFTTMDVEAKVVVMCRVSRRGKVPHLSVDLTVEDSGSHYNVHGEIEEPGGEVRSEFYVPTDPDMPKVSPIIMPRDDVPETTHYFEADFGVCTDPITHGDATPGVPGLDDVDEKLKCSGGIGHEGADVRECTCNSQCAMFGDPYVYDFFAPHFPKDRLGFTPAKPFKIDKRANLEPQEKKLFSFWDHIAVAFEVSEGCEQVNSITTYILKPEKVSGDSCKKVGHGRSSPSKLAEYNVKTYRADALCRGRPHGYTIALPEIELGYIGTVKDKKDSVYMKNWNAATVKYCESLLSSKIDSVVNLGTLKVNLACHQNKKSEYFFNVCVNLNEATRKYWVTKRRNFNPKPIKPDGLDPKFFRALLEMEKKGRTAGWCAIGDYKSGGYPGDKKGANHKRRSNADLFHFPTPK